MGRALFGNEVRQHSTGPRVLGEAKPFTVSPSEAEDWRAKTHNPEAVARQAAIDTLRYQREYTAAALGQKAMEELFASDGPQQLNATPNQLGGVAIVGIIRQERQTILV